MPLLVWDVFANPYMIGLSIANFFVSVVRQGAYSWLLFFFIQARTLSYFLV